MALFAMGSAAPARAQIDDELTQDWDLRAGFFVPERGAVRQSKGDLWLTIGAEKRFADYDRYRATISIDYYGSGNVYNIPITLNLRTTTNRFRYGAGVGLGISHDLNRGINGLTYNLMVGYDITESANPLSLDLRYIVQRTSSALNGLAVTVGGHF
jgi:hypothetical protein